MSRSHRGLTALVGCAEMYESGRGVRTSATLCNSSDNYFPRTSNAAAASDCSGCQPVPSLMASVTSFTCSVSLKDQPPKVSAVFLSVLTTTQYCCPAVSG